MKLTDYRTMLYLPKEIYMKALLASKRQKKPLSALIREALAQYLSKPAKGDYLRSLRAGFGLWRGQEEDGVQYENRMRKQWDRRD